MRLRRLKKTMMAIVLAAIAVVLVGCGAPAGPPAPPIEIPSPVVLKFVPYEEIKIDFSSIAAGDAASLSVYNAVGAGGEFSDLISIGPSILVGAEAVVDTMLADLSSLEIPLSDDVRTWEGTVVSLDATGVETTWPVKIDFADFDLDGDGIKEGCSGHTAVLPVCVRMWREDARVIAWVFDEYYVEGYPGASRFRIYTEKPGSYQRFAASFDYRDLEDRLLDAFMQRVSDEIVGAEGGVIEIHVQAIQKGPVASAFKRLNLNKATEGKEGVFTTQYIGQFIEGEDFWSGSLFDSESMTSVDNQCARISTGDGTPQGNCDDLGISVAGIPFVAPLTDADVEFYDFPETPTF